MMNVKQIVLGLSKLQIWETLLVPQTEGFPCQQTTTDISASTEVCIDVCICIYQNSVTKYVNVFLIFPLIYVR